MTSVTINILSPTNMGKLVLPREVDGEEFLRALVTKPTETVQWLVSSLYETPWSESEPKIVAALAAAKTQDERNEIKKLIPALVPGKFQGANRLGAECLGRQIIGHDFDRVVAETFEEACAKIRAQLPDRFLVIHTTASEHNPDGTWRLRAFELIDRETTPTEWEERVKPHMSALGETDKNALDVVRLLYMPVRTAGYRFKVFGGPRTKLDSLPVATPGYRLAERSAAVAPSSDDARRKAVAVLVAAYPGKGRHLVQRAIAGGLIHDEWSEHNAVEFLCDVCRGAGDEDREKRIKTVRSTLKRRADGKSYDGWTKLEKYIGADLVTGVRKLLDGTAATERQIAEREAARSAPPAKDTEVDLGEAVFDWDQVDAPIQWVIQDIIQEATVNLLFGKPNSRKSWLAWLMAAEVSRGALWLGKVTSRGTIVILDYEGSPRTSRRRMRLLKKAGLKNIRYFNPKLALDDERLWKRLAKMGACLIVVDSLSRGMLRGGVKDQASDPRMSVPLDLAKHLARDTKTSTLFVHHGNKGDIKGQDAVRGSGAIYAAAEGCFEAMRDDDTRTTLRCDRQKEGESFPDIAVELTDANGLQLVDADAPASRRMSFDEIKAALKLQVEAHPDGAGPEELVRKAGVRDAKVGAKALKELKESGAIFWKKTRQGAMYLPTRQRSASEIRTAVIRAVRAGVSGTQDICRLVGVEETSLVTMASEGLIFRSGQSWVDTPAGHLLISSNGGG